VRERRHYIDWLRVFAVLALFDFHTARIFDEGRFYVKNEESGILFDMLVGFMNVWHMPLFFLVSGVGTYYALGLRSGGEYAKERAKRLLVPLVFGTLVIVSPLVYYRLLADPSYTKNFIEFYPDFFRGIAPEGNFEWGHLWFLAYLFVFSMIALPVFRYIKAGGKWIAEFVFRLCEKPGGIFLLALPLSIVQATLRVTYPDGNQNLVSDWANFFLYLLIFIYGFLIVADPRMEDAIQKHWRLAGLLAVVITVALFAAALSGMIDPWDEYHPMRIVFEILRGLDTWCWLIVFMGAARRFLDFGDGILDYANQAVLPVYVLHQTAIVIIGFYVVRLDTNMYAKFVYIDLAAFFATLFIYDALIKRWDPVRFFFGMRPKKKAVKKGTSSSDGRVP